MKYIESFYKWIILSLMMVVVSCDDLTELNVNPNGVDPETVNPNLMVTTILTNTAQTYLAQGYNERFAGVIPIFSANSIDDIFLLAIITSKLTIII